MKQFDEAQTSAPKISAPQTAFSTMSPKATADSKIAVIGGDGRQIAVAEALTMLFPEVRIYGPPPTTIPATLKLCESLGETIGDVKVVILPISGMNDAGLIRGYRVDQMIDFGNWLGSLSEGTIVVAGSLTAKWLQKLDSLKLKVILYAEDDELAILNSIPTAEGAVQLAMEELPITIHGSTVMVIGFGRVGETVARTFRALGARVFVVARREAVLARAYEMGCETLLLDSLAVHAGVADIIINTVPATVINGNILTRVKPAVLIIDLASAPGGTDFETAQKLNIKAKLAPGLPGIVAPRTAGEILARIIPNLIKGFLTSAENAVKVDGEADVVKNLKDGGVSNAVFRY